jgi:hypothetical protein
MVTSVLVYNLSHYAVSPRQERKSALSYRLDHMVNYYHTLGRQIYNIILSAGCILQQF